MRDVAAHNRCRRKEISSMIVNMHKMSDATATTSPSTGKEKHSRSHSHGMVEKAASCIAVDIICAAVSGETRMSAIYMISQAAIRVEVLL